MASTTSNDGALTVNVDAPDSLDFQNTGTVSLTMNANLGGPTQQYAGTDIMAVMDASGSIGTAGWAADKDFVSHIIQLAHGPTTRFAIDEFSATAILEWGFTDQQVPITPLLNKVASLPWMASYTSTLDAMQLAANTYASQSSSNRAKLVLLITDGVPTPYYQNPCLTSGAGAYVLRAQQLRDKLHQLNIRTIIIGVGNQINSTNLSCLLASPQDYIPAASFSPSDLSAVLSQLNPIIHPALKNVKVTAHVDQAFNAGALTSTDTGATASVASYAFDAATRTVTWNVGSIGTDSHELSIPITASDSVAPLCSLQNALTNVQASYTDMSGNTQTVSLPNTAVKITGCVPPKVDSTITGTLGNNGWYTSDVGISWTVQPHVLPITSETGCSAKTLNADTADSTFTCTATSDEGTTSKSVTVKRDATPPTIAFAGNAGTYNLSDVVEISCTASDAMSGLAPGSVCPSVSDSAWTLTAGNHRLLANAADNAGNTASDSTSFTVVVTLQDLINFSKAWVSGPGAQGVANSLAAKLTGKHPQLQAFINEVKAQSGKKIPADKATLLEQWAQSLL